MRRYFALGSDPAAPRAQLDANHLDDSQLARVFNGPAPDPADRPAALRALIDADRAQLTAAPETNTEAKPNKDGKRPTMDSPFDPAKKHPGPEHGFLTIGKEIVLAFKEADPAMRWGGTDFGAECGDLMHFDLGTGITHDPKTGIFSRKAHT